MSGDYYYFLLTGLTVRLLNRLSLNFIKGSRAEVQVLGTVVARPRPQLGRRQPRPLLELLNLGTTINIKRCPLPHRRCLQDTMDIFLLFLQINNILSFVACTFPSFPHNGSSIYSYDYPASATEEK